MSKAYPSNLTRAQYEFLSDLIPEPKPGGRKREVNMWEVLNAIFASFGGRSEMESIAWRFPSLADSVHTIENWCKDGTWLHIHDCLREWTRIEQERHRCPTFAIIDLHSVKSAAMVSIAVGYDAGKKITGRKRFMTVDTLGLVLRVLVTAANVGERFGGKQVLKRVKQSPRQASRLTTI